MVATGLLLLYLYQPAFAQEILTFHGDLDFTQSDFRLFVKFGENDFIQASAKQLKDSDYHVKLNVEHLKTPIFDLSSEIESLIAVLNSENASGKKLKGRLWSNYSILNYKPIRELSGNFEIDGKRVHLREVIFGSIRCSGYIDFLDPFKVDLDFDLSSIGMEDFLAFWTGSEIYEASGDVSGEIYVTGSLKQPVLRGNLLSNNGLIKPLKYQTMKLNIEGLYPRMQILQSYISQSDGLSFSFNGPIDLSDKTNFKKQIKALSIVPLVQNTEDRIEWTIKEFGEEEGSSTKIKYLKIKNQDDTRFSQENGDILGVERSVDF